MNDEEDDYDKMKIREVKRRRKITTITTKTITNTITESSIVDMIPSDTLYIITKSIESTNP